jgi:hypothetical protein
VKRLASLPRAVRAYAAIVLLNYAAQVAYAADLYGTRINVAGAALLGATLAWFLVGLWGLAAGRRVGHPVLLAYALTQAAFYFHGQVLLAFEGYGMLYALTHARDGVVWGVFVVGDLNFVAAVGAAVYLVVRRRSLGTPT